MTTEVITTVEVLRQKIRDASRSGKSIGFVPTMGYLHDGHAQLIRRARIDNDVVVVSIFVNPLQFAPTEDLAAYPRDLPRDVAIVTQAGGDLVFHPDVSEMYPQEMLTTVTVTKITDRFEGAARPAHFAGVASVVAKLFGIVGPCRAYFGEKDFQQLAVVRRLVSDLSIPVEVIGVPTVREKDGLAMSSRNVYLNPDERLAAPVLYRALCAGRDAILAGEADAQNVHSHMRAVLETEPAFEIDYVAAVDAETLGDLPKLVGSVRLLVAGRLGKPRLLDNLGVEVPDGGRTKS